MFFVLMEPWKMLFNSLTHLVDQRRLRLWVPYVSAFQKTYELSNRFKQSANLECQLLSSHSI